ncbi:Uncharacterised protein [Mycobacterium tuberculosis]|nr:Uncharacterised protein [Mycobacterium tuberculosis]
MKKMVESPMMVVRRPNRSEMRPHPSAPIAAAKASDPVTQPWAVESMPSSRLMGSSAPLITPVS